MGEVLDETRLSAEVERIWKMVQPLKGKLKAYEYYAVIQPMVLIRRIECILIPWRAGQREKLLAQRGSIGDAELEQTLKAAERASDDIQFHNTTHWTLEKVLKSGKKEMEKNFFEYINGFSDNVRALFIKFDFKANVRQMVLKKRLEPIVKTFVKEDYSLKAFSHDEMGFIFEALQKRFKDQRQVY